MTEITLYYPAGTAADPEALAAALREGCAGIAGVEDAAVARDRMIGADDIIVILTVSVKVLGAGALALEALRKFIDAAKGVGRSLGIRKLAVEGAGRVVDADALTEADATAVVGNAR